MFAPGVKDGVDDEAPLFGIPDECGLCNPGVEDEAAGEAPK